MSQPNGLLKTPGADVFPYPVQYAALFDGTGDFLSRTPSSVGGEKTWTFRTCLKLAETGQPANGPALLCVHSDANNRTALFMEANQLRFIVRIGGTNVVSITTDGLLADPTGWGDLVVRYDSTRTVANDRFMVEWNGLAVPLTTTTAVPLNQDSLVNDTRPHFIGKHAYSGELHDGYLADTYLIDGQALPASTWGKFSGEVTGLWVPKDPGELDFGTNGCRLGFLNVSGLGNDSAFRFFDNVAPDPDFSEGTGGGWSTSDTVAFSGGTVEITDSGYCVAILPGVTNGEKFLVAATVVSVTGTPYFRMYDGVNVAYAPEISAAGVHYAILTITDDTKQCYCGLGSNSGEVITASELDIYKIHDTYDGPNDWTVNGSPTQSLDTPTDNYATLNPLAWLASYDSGSLSNGNLTATADASGHYAPPSTMRLFDGAYWEVTVDLTNETSGYPAAGVARENAIANIGGDTNGIVMMFSSPHNGKTYYDNTLSDSAYTTWLTGDIAMFAYSEGKLWIGRNGTWLDSGNPAAGTGYIKDMGDADDWLACCQVYGSQTLAFNFGATGFTHTPPIGFNAICSQNLPDPAVRKSARVADIVLRTGTGAAASVSSLLFSPDFVNIKDRDSGSANWQLTDSERGVFSQIETNTTDAASTWTNYVTSLDATGYGIGNAAVVNNAGDSFLDFCLKAGVEQGFEIINYAGTGSAHAIPHSLGKSPTFMLVKDIDASADWLVYHTALGATKYLSFTSGAAVAASSVWNNTEPTSTTITVGTNAAINSAGHNYIAYLWTDSDIFKAFSYTGNGSADGPFVNLGGRPLAVPFCKNASGVYNWFNIDGARNPHNDVDALLMPDLTSAEAVSSLCNFTSQGIKIIATTGFSNGSTHTIIGLAVMESAGKYASAF